MPTSKPTSTKTLIDLETKFWQSLVNQDTDAAVEMLSEPALMVTSHGAMKFDHSDYRKMAKQGPMVLKSYELSDVDVVFPNTVTAILTYRVKQDFAPRADGPSALDQKTATEMNDTSTWVLKGKRWQCVMHTETPADPAHIEH